MWRKVSIFSFLLCAILCVFFTANALGWFKNEMRTKSHNDAKHTPDNLQATYTGANHTSRVSKRNSSATPGSDVENTAHIYKSITLKRSRRAGKDYDYADTETPDDDPEDDNPYTIQMPEDDDRDKGKIVPYVNRFAGPSTGQVEIHECDDELDEDCIIYSERKSLHVPVHGENQLGGALMGLGANILSGLASADLGSLISGVKHIFAPSTEDYHKKLTQDDHLAMKSSEKLYESVDLLFQGMMKEEAKLHSRLLARLAKTEKMQTDVLTRVEMYSQYQFYASVIFYSAVTLLVSYNVLRRPQEYRQ